MQMLNNGGNSINSINSIYLGGFDPYAVNPGSMPFNLSFVQGSNKSSGSGNVSFADKLKNAYDK